MKARTLTTIGLVALSLSVSAKSPTAYEFSGELTANNSTFMAFGISMNSQMVRFIDVEPGMRLEVSSPSGAAGAATATVRLLQSAEDSFKVLHEAQFVDHKEGPKTFSYLVCGKSVTFLVPAPAKTPRCGT